MPAAQRDAQPSCVPLFVFSSLYHGPNLICSLQLHINGPSIRFLEVGDTVLEIDGTAHDQSFSAAEAACFTTRKASCRGMNITHRQCRQRPRVHAVSNGRCRSSWCCWCLSARFALAFRHALTPVDRQRSCDQNFETGMQLYIGCRLFPRLFCFSFRQRVSHVSRGQPTPPKLLFSAILLKKWADEATIFSAKTSTRLSGSVAG